MGWAGTPPACCAPGGTRTCSPWPPTVVSILVGINDTWRRYDRGTPTSTGQYEGNLRALVEGVDRLVLVEPFVVPVDAAQHA